MTKKCLKTKSKMSEITKLSDNCDAGVRKFLKVYSPKGLVKSQIHSPQEIFTGPLSSNLVKPIARKLYLYYKYSKTY